MPCATEIATYLRYILSRVTLGSDDGWANIAKKPVDMLKPDSVGRESINNNIKD